MSSVYGLVSVSLFSSSAAMERDGWTCQELCFLPRKTEEEIWSGTEIGPERLRLLSKKVYSRDDLGRIVRGGRWVRRHGVQAHLQRLLTARLRGEGSAWRGGGLGGVVLQSKRRRMPLVRRNAYKDRERGREGAKAGW